MKSLVVLLMTPVILFSSLGMSPISAPVTPTKTVVESPIEEVLPSEEALPETCLAGIDEIHDEAGTLEFEVPDDYSMAFTCAGEIANVEYIDEDTDSVVGAATVDVTDENTEVVDLSAYIEDDEIVLSEADKEELGIPEVEVEWSEETAEVETGAQPQALSFLASFNAITVADSYHMGANQRVYWGVKVNGKVSWSRSARLFLRTSVGTYTTSKLSVTSTPAGNYQIAFGGTAFVKKHLRAAPDPTHDSYYMQQGTYSSNSWKTQPTLLHARGAGKYYQTLTNISINDRSKGRKFGISNSFSLPRFQCYKTVVCKFPKGNPAPY